jgi:molecular chaperone DnaK
MGGVMTRMIERNTTIPVAKSEVFSTAADGQTAVDIHILQGERPMASDNMSLGMFRLDGIPMAARGIPQIEVSFDIDANGILHVTAKDKASGKEQKITVTATTNLNQGEIDRLVREADQHRSADQRRQQLAQARNEADTLVYQAEHALRDLGDKVPGSDRATIERQIADAKQAITSDDASRIREAAQALQSATYALSQQMYASQTDTSGGSAGPSPSGRGDDVVEGEYHEA